MNTNELLREIQRLPIRKRIYLIEQPYNQFKKSEDVEQMQIAAESLYTDYVPECKFISFTGKDLL